MGIGLANEIMGLCPGPTQAGQQDCHKHSQNRQDHQESNETKAGVLNACFSVERHLGALPHLCSTNRLAGP